MPRAKGVTRCSGLDLHRPCASISTTSSCELADYDRLYAYVRVDSSTVDSLQSIAEFCVVVPDKMRLFVARNVDVFYIEKRQPTITDVHS